MKCAFCENNHDCIESCIDCICVSCIYRNELDSCCLSPLSDYSNTNEDSEEDK